MKIKVLPPDNGASGWARLLPKRQARPPLTSDITADWVVVGAGFAGLAAARRLAENQPDASIVLLEANRVGDGASGRNSGFAIDLPIGFGTSEAALQDSRRRIRLARAGVDYLEACVSRGQIDCHWRKIGRYHAAVGPDGKRRLLDPYAKVLEALGEPHRWLGREELAGTIGTDHYHAAVHSPGGAQLNPVALTRGLADTLPDNVTLYESTPVIEAHYEDRVRLVTPTGNLSAGGMVLATNGFAEQFGFFGGRLMIFALHASLSRQLTEREQSELGWIEDWGLTTSGSAAGVTVRYTADHRILIRKKFDYSPSFRVSAAEQLSVRKLHQDALLQRFPRLSELTIETTWHGFSCVSRNMAQGFGRVAQNVYAAVCQNSLGVTMGTISGLLTADLAQQKSNALIADMQQLGTPVRLPPRPLLQMGIKARFAWDVWTAGSLT